MYFRIKKIKNDLVNINDYYLIVKRIEILKKVHKLFDNNLTNKEFCEIVCGLYEVELEECDIQVLAKTTLKSETIQLRTLKVNDPFKKLENVTVYYYSFKNPLDLEHTYTIEEIKSLINAGKAVLYSLNVENVYFEQIPLDNINVNNLGSYSNEIIAIMKKTLANRLYIDILEMIKITKSELLSLQKELLKNQENSYKKDINIEELFISLNSINLARKKV